MKSIDIKTIRFPEEEFTLDTTFFIQEGVPETKVLTISVIKCLPGGKSEPVATGTVDLRDHFGDQFDHASIDMEPLKSAKGISCKRLLYRADVTCLQPTDMHLFDQCVAWRKKVLEDQRAKEDYERAKSKFITESESLIEDLDGKSEGGLKNQARAATLINMIPGFAKDMLPVPISKQSSEKLRTPRE